MHPTFRWLERGEGEPIVLLHGLMGRMDHWDSTLQALAPIGRPIAPDVPILDEALGDPSVGGLTEHVRAFLDALEIQTAVVGGIRQLLDEQLARLSPLEQALLYWLAIEREPVRFAALLADLGPEVAQSEVLEALEALDRRSLLERASAGAFTLQPVVLEYISERLVTALAREILVGQPVLLRRHAVLLATAKDYVRRSQERLLGQPIVQNLVAASGVGGAERRMLELLEGWRQREPAETKKPSAMTPPPSRRCLPVTVTTASVPSVMMTTPSAPTVMMAASTAMSVVTMTVPVAALDLDQGAVLRVQRSHTQSGRSGYGHCK